jgi:chromosome segregation ATPase
MKPLRGLLVMPFVVLFGCSATEATPPPTSPRESGQAHFARGDLRFAIAALQRALREARTEEDVAEVRFFIALSRIAEGQSTRGLADLRAVEFEHAKSRWGRLAGIITAEIARGRVLREAVMAAGAGVRGAQEEVKAEQARIEALTAQLSEQQDALASAREERARALAQLNAANDTIGAQAARIKELQEKLDAMKKIDMQRQP